jgi:hypothetical protein
MSLSRAETLVRVGNSDGLVAVSHRFTAFCSDQWVGGCSSQTAGSVERDQRERRLGEGVGMEKPRVAELEAFDELASRKGPCP